jgi:hypothetical protein
MQMNVCPEKTILQRVFGILVIPDNAEDSAPKPSRTTSSQFDKRSFVATLGRLQQLILGCMLMAEGSLVFAVLVDYQQHPWLDSARQRHRLAT